jgi:hypothetical protein
MTIDELKEQMQQDVLSLLESWRVEEAMIAEDYEKFKTLLCNLIITNVNKLGKKG